MTRRASNSPIKFAGDRGIIIQPDPTFSTIILLKEKFNGKNKDLFKHTSILNWQFNFHSIRYRARRSEMHS